ncbi:angiopoietin-related protein 4-like [Pomacea canaliculata]|uniref:angiopoietin-related protein 4-like n=1 Tax=Pomacea canaliculata TaxID=400727 RepID=UPI000D7320C8|nr:angiopoietin-related protein 4-like [Pomacea canaliculata]
MAYKMFLFLTMASMWSLLLPLLFLGLTAPLGSSALTRENFFDRIDLCSGTLPGTSSFPDVSKFSCAMKCSESEACTAFTFTVSSGTCNLHYELDLTSHLCAASSATMLHFQKKSSIICLNGGHAIGSACKCFNSYVGSQCERLALDCKDIISSGYYGDALPGMFSIQPSRATTPFRVLCNPKVQQIILDRYYNVPSFNRSMTDYVAGFGDAVNDFWVGLEKLHLLTSSMSYVLCVQVSFGTTKYQRYYTKFVVQGAGNGYSMSFGGQYDPSSVALPMGDCLTPLQNVSFSTYDVDNDGNATYNCAENYGGGWWYNQQCSDCNLVGKVSKSATRVPESVDDVFWNPGLNRTAAPSYVSVFLFRS